MKKIILLIPLMLLSSMEDVNAMRGHRKSMKRMHARRGGGKRRKMSCHLPKHKKSRRRKKDIGRKKKMGERVDLVASLSVPAAPEKTFSVSALVPRFDFSFANKDLISRVLLLYVIFGQILSSQQVSCTVLYGYDDGRSAGESNWDAHDRKWGSSYTSPTARANAAAAASLVPSAISAIDNIAAGEKERMKFWK